MSRNWLDPIAQLVPPDLQALIDGDAIVAQALVQRGLSDIHSAQAFLDPQVYTPASPYELAGMDTAVKHLLSAIKEHQLICVWGDFDADGQTATTLLVSALRDLGGRVCFYIPVRERESHGIHIPSLEPLLDSGVKVLLTCDTGITANLAVDYSMNRSVDVIITDHHLPAEKLPRATAIINPHLLASKSHPLASLPGVGVAYKLAEALYTATSRGGESQSLLDLAALGIVADLAPLIGEARWQLQRGLPLLRSTARLGLQELFALADLNLSGINEEHIGYVIAPRLNALGRLADANSIVEFFTTRDPIRARTLAMELDGLNSRRKLLTDQVYQAALSQIENDVGLIENNTIVLAGNSWHPGVVGIVASRFVERFNRPVVILSISQDGLARGSARSIEGVDITLAISKQADLIDGFGGHPMAAGLAMKAENIAAFRQGLEQAVLDQTGGVIALPPLQIDAYLSFSELSLDFIQNIERLSPFGPGNPPLVLAVKNLSLETYKEIGRTGDHLRLKVADETGQTREVLWWQGKSSDLPTGRFDLAFNAHATTYGGHRNVQITWIESRPSITAGKPIEILRPQRQMIDYRHVAEPESALRSLLNSEPNLQVWAEADNRNIPTAVNRLNLKSCSSLVIWHIPPGHVELVSAIEQSSPQKVFLFAQEPGMDQPEAFLTRLAGLVKYAINHKEGYASIDELAAACSQRRFSIQAGLAWLEARGVVEFTRLDENTIQLTKGTRQPQSSFPQMDGQLRYVMQETAAYRAFYQRATLDVLL